MACSSDFVDFIVDQCVGAGEISVRKMMGDYCIYCDGTIFGLICDNNLYVKVTEAGRAVLEEVVLRPPYEGGKDFRFKIEFQNWLHRNAGLTYRDAVEVYPELIPPRR